jgi:hypothetical protein
MSGSCTLGTTGYRLRSNKFGYDTVPYYDTRLTNLIPHIKYGATTPG